MQFNSLSGVISQKFGLAHCGDVGVCEVPERPRALPLTSFSATRSHDGIYAMQSLLNADFWHCSLLRRTMAEICFS